MKFKIVVLTLLTFCIVSACNKDDNFDYPAGTVGISRITVFPIVELKGESLVVLKKGSAYTEEGVSAKEGETDITATTSGSVDINSPGVYTLTYTAANKDGFTASAKRTVVVYETDATAAANDFSGDYARTNNGQIATWTKLASGVYQVLNPGGAVGATLTVIVFNPTGFQIDIPEQISSDGNTTSSTDEVYTNGAPAKYSWKIVNPGYGPALRNFVKQ